MPMWLIIQLVSIASMPATYDNGSRPWQIDQRLAQHGLDLWAIGASRAPYSGQAQQRSSTDSVLNRHDKGGENGFDLYQNRSWGWRGDT
jgi:hypothetical protein